MAHIKLIRMWIPSRVVKGFQNSNGISIIKLLCLHKVLVLSLVICKLLEQAVLVL